MKPFNSSRILLFPVNNICSVINLSHKIYNVIIYLLFNFTIPLETCNKGSKPVVAETFPSVKCRKNPRPGGDFIHRQLAV